MQGGVDAVGLVELMGAAGLTRRGFYNHFASKDALVDTVVTKARAEGFGNLDEAITASQARGSDPHLDRFTQIVQAPGLPEGERRARAIALFSEMAGALLLSRALADADPALADEILDSARTDLHSRTGAG